MTIKYSDDGFDATSQTPEPIKQDEMTIREAMNHISEFARFNHTAPGAATAQNAVAKICNAISQIQHLVK